MRVTGLNEEWISKKETVFDGCLVLFVMKENANKIKRLLQQTKIVKIYTENSSKIVDKNRHFQNLLQTRAIEQFGL